VLGKKLLLPLFLIPNLGFADGFESSAPLQLKKEIKDD